MSIAVKGGAILISVDKVVGTVHTTVIYGIPGALVLASLAAIVAILLLALIAARNKRDSKLDTPI
jgi:hypothetical protein